MQMHHGMQQLATIMALTTRSAAYDVPFGIDKWQEFLVVIFHINYFFVILSETKDLALDSARDSARCFTVFSMTLNV